ncbi:hypothetical protein TgHK011_007101 [Trichoderma gracile]|nr:hypothetical protein TgHK011_007101 [Trichoderma gracile]
MDGRGGAGNGGEWTPGGALAHSRDRARQRWLDSWGRAGTAGEGPWSHWSGRVTSSLAGSGCGMSANEGAPTPWSGFWSEPWRRSVAASGGRLPANQGCASVRTKQLYLLRWSCSYLYP